MYSAPFPVAACAQDLGRPSAEQYNGAMRVVLVSKALVVGAYQRKAEEIAALGVDLTV